MATQIGVMLLLPFLLWGCGDDDQKKKNQKAKTISVPVVSGPPQPVSTPSHPPSPPPQQSEPAQPVQSQLTHSAMARPLQVPVVTEPSQPARRTPPQHPSPPRRQSSPGRYINYQMVAPPQPWQPSEWPMAHSEPGTWPQSPPYHHIWVPETSFDEWVHEDPESSEDHVDHYKTEKEPPCECHHKTSAVQAKPTEHVEHIERIGGKAKQVKKHHAHVKVEESSQGKEEKKEKKVPVVRPPPPSKNRWDRKGSDRKGWQHEGRLSQEPSTPLRNSHGRWQPSEWTVAHPEPGATEVSWPEDRKGWHLNGRDHQVSKQYDWVERE